MPDEEWIKTLEDGRKVKFFYQELAEDGAFISVRADCRQ
jgi:DNA-directed RNA polymerase delta subunit